MKACNNRTILPPHLSFVCIFKAYTEISLISRHHYFEDISLHHRTPNTGSPNAMDGVNADFAGAKICPSADVLIFAARAIFKKCGISHTT
ncbi:hypothetical protein [Methylotuvimicrobium alcaliphilum]|uniref:hypothetical protein n=1 Tax=Methylotuvimicrobium alcaliphilum TaxID=271065 RepID=UPI001392469C|nr:hypothetical protein [Methylotuvimicrobium alcaliphilum]